MSQFLKIKIGFLCIFVKYHHLFFWSVQYLDGNFFFKFHYNKETIELEKISKNERDHEDIDFLQFLSAIVDKITIDRWPVWDCKISILPLFLFINLEEKQKDAISVYVKELFLCTGNHYGIRSKQTNL